MPTVKSEERESNIILFGLPESHTLLESKHLVGEMLEFFVGKLVQIRHLLRLGKVNRPSSQTRPRPILIKLSVA